MTNEDIEKLGDIYPGADIHIPEVDLGEGDRGAWFQTYTGLKLNPATMQPKDVRLEDIAHALSMLCRFGGHCERFYSVAEHSVYVSQDRRLSTNFVRRKALAHDFSEAYVLDMPRPVKHLSLMSGYRLIEHRVEKVVAAAFGLDSQSDYVRYEVKNADDLMLATEAHFLMPDQANGWHLREEPDTTFVIECWGPMLAKRELLKRFVALWGTR